MSIKPLTEGQWVKFTFTVTLKVETKGSEKGDEWALLSFCCRLCQSPKSSGDPGWVDKSSCLLANFQKQENCVATTSGKWKLGALCMCTWVQVRLREERCHWACWFGQPGKQIHAYFLKPCDSWLSYSKRQSEHLCYHRWNGHNKIFYIFYEMLFYD